MINCNENENYNGKNKSHVDKRNRPTRRYRENYTNNVVSQ